MTFDEIARAVDMRMATLPDVAYQVGTNSDPATVTKPIPIAWDNVPAGADVITAQNARTPWVRVTLIDGDSFTAGIGSGPCVRRTGLISVQVFTARDIGSGPARQIASSIAAHIEYYQSGALETQAARLINAGPDDNYYMAVVQCGFRAG